MGQLNCCSHVDTLVSEVVPAELSKSYDAFPGSPPFSEVATFTENSKERTLYDSQLVSEELCATDMVDALGTNCATADALEDQVAPSVAEQGDIQSATLLLHQCRPLDAARFLPEENGPDETDLWRDLRHQARMCREALDLIGGWSLDDDLHKRDSGRDLMPFSIELDEDGVRVDGVMEFFADGSLAFNWKASDVPVPLDHVVCLTHEIDLAHEFVPFMEVSELVHQFRWNEPDRIVRIITKPPIPFVAGVETVAQRFAFDLLDSEFEGLCLMETGPVWEAAAGEPDKLRYRGFEKPPATNKKFKQVKVKTLVALACPSGPTGERTTITFRAQGNVGISRGLLPNWLLQSILKQAAKIVYRQCLDKITKFDTSKYAARLEDSVFYDNIKARLAAHTARKGGHG